MDLGLTGQVVLITGGSKGIGLACAHAFALEGARIAIASRSAENLEAGACWLQQQGHAVHTVAADLRRAEDAEAMVRHVEAALGPVDVLVNSAGAAQRTPPFELTAAHWHAAMDAKYFTTIHAMQAVLAGMGARGRGSIVNVVGAGGMVASPTHVPGGAANAALMLASAGLALAWAPRGVRINVVNPGLVATTRMQEGLQAQSRMTGETVDALEERLRKGMPLGRLAQADDVARMVGMLASHVAAYVSGAALTIDGAVTALPH